MSGARGSTSLRFGSASGVAGEADPDPALEPTRRHLTTTTFGTLGVSDDLVAALSADGISEPFPVQELTIRDALAGRDVCGKAKTGSGKTLAFGLPLIQTTPAGADPGHPTAMVLVPTRELAGQVHDVLAPLAKARGLR